MQFVFVFMIMEYGPVQQPFGSFNRNVFFPSRISNRAMTLIFFLVKAIDSTECQNQKR